MDKSKGEPVISVKTKSKERVSKHLSNSQFIQPLSLSNFSPILNFAV